MFIGSTSLADQTIKTNKNEELYIDSLQIIVGVLSESFRELHQVPDTVKGLAVLGVDKGSQAFSKNITKGSVIVGLSFKTLNNNVIDRIIGKPNDLKSILEGRVIVSKSAKADKSFQRVLLRIWRPSSKLQSFVSINLLDKHKYNTDTASSFSKNIDFFDPNFCEHFDKNCEKRALHLKIKDKISEYIRSSKQRINSIVKCKDKYGFFSYENTWNNCVGRKRYSSNDLGLLGNLNESAAGRNYRIEKEKREGSYFSFVFEGEYKSGYSYGFGKTVFDEGVYIGDHRGFNNFEGSGLAEWGNGSGDEYKQYSGKWKNGLFNGEGTLELYNGEIITGIFQNGFFIGTREYIENQKKLKVEQEKINRIKRAKEEELKRIKRAKEEELERQYQIEQNEIEQKENAERIKREEIYDNCIIDLMPPIVSDVLKNSISRKCERISQDPSLYKDYKYKD